MAVEERKQEYLLEGEKIRLININSSREKEIRRWFQEFGGVAEFEKYAKSFISEDNFLGALDRFLSTPIFFVDENLMSFFDETIDEEEQEESVLIDSTEEEELEDLEEEESNDKIEIYRKLAF